MHNAQVFFGDDNDNALVLFGVQSDVVFYGEEGDDAMIGGQGRNTFFAGPGNDLMRAPSKGSFMVGEEGDDVLYGSFGQDVLLGGAGHDRFYGEEGHDLALMDEGNDLAFGGGGDDYLDGGAGDDVLIGGAGEDTLWGGQGNDTLYLDAADVLAHGGRGADRFVLTGERGDNRIRLPDFDAEEGDTLDLSQVFQYGVPSMVTLRGDELQVDTDGDDFFIGGVFVSSMAIALDMASFFFGFEDFFGKG